MKFFIWPYGGDSASLFNDSISQRFLNDSFYEENGMYTFPNED